jgi:hypothetical protein
MNGFRFACALLAGAACWGVTSLASAADLPVKAKASPPVAAPTSDIHGFFDVSFKNDYITPRGLLVTNTGLTTQILMGLSGDVYKDKAGFINLVSLYGGVWSDLWSDQPDFIAANGNINGDRTDRVGVWNEFDWFVGMNIKFAQDWTFGVQYIEFISPPHLFPGVERNIEFSLAYDDSKWNTVLPLHPYVKLFWAADGPSTVVFGKQGDTFDVEFGLVPTLDLNKYKIPVVLTAPTWVTVGPSTYWNNGVTGCGPTPASPCESSNAGVFSTGLTGRTPLTFMPPNLGKWSVYAGFQYYYLINDTLLLAQTATGTAANYASAHRDVFLGFGGVSFNF